MLHYGIAGVFGAPRPTEKQTGPVYTQSGYCHQWGRAKNARRVHGLSVDDKAAIRAGQSVRLAGCPAVGGVTDRRVIERNGRFYARMP